MSFDCSAGISLEFHCFVLDELVFWDGNVKEKQGNKDDTGPFWTSKNE